MITRKNRAFLLTEVLVTVVIVSSAIIFINHAFTNSLKSSAIANDYLSALFFLEDKSFDSELKPQEEIEKGEVSQEEEFMGRKFAFEQEALPLEKEELGDEYEEEDLGLKRLVLSAGWKRQEAERTISTETYIMETEPLEDESASGEKQE